MDGIGTSLDLRSAVGAEAEKKEKNCHGRRPAVATAPAVAAGAHLREVTKKPEVVVSPWGVPGEEHKIIVAPIFKGTPGPTQADIRGQRGKYRVQFLLARPGYPIRKEREHKFIDDVVGTSHIKIVKPEAERSLNDADRIVLQLLGKNYQIIGIADKDGLLGKLICELDADSNQAAETEAYGSLAPFLSAWSMNVDVPIHVETIQVTNLTTHVSFLRAVTPHFEMNFGGGTQPFFLDEFCQYASIYREGLNTNSAFYRFLCFYKIIESLIGKRGREAKAKRLAGQDPRRSYEVIPEKSEDVLALLKRLYPWRDTWDKMALAQIFPQEVIGEKVTAIRDKHFRPLRLGIAHALLDTGEITVILDKMEYIQAVNKWLPLCRICARWMLLNDFPRECSLAMK
jgi:Methylamine utilization protein MauJ